jgi:pantoate--beta-alanine ligase
MSEAAAGRTDVVRDVPGLRAIVAGWRRGGATVGLVPTMGALHDGHRALIAAARRAGHRVVVSLFVNPTQFGPHEDFAAYPRDEAADLAIIAEQGAALLFAPPVEAVYPRGFSTTVGVGNLGEPFEGEFRPGHFAGVATVVTKLLLMALPDAAYFGEKDYQQLQVIRRLVRDLDIPVAIVGVPTVREADGLALSSRNRYLGPADRAMAAALPRVMRETAAALASGTPVAAALSAGRRALTAAGFAAVDYLAAVDPATLRPVEAIDGPARLLVAAHLGHTRLIDNWPIEPGIRHA